MRRVGLNLERAAARIRQDIWDDLWPDPLGWMELPTTKRGAFTARRHVDAFRKGKTVPRATVALVPKPNGLMRPAHILTPWSRLYYQALVDSFMFEIDGRLGGRDHVFGYRTMGPRLGAAPFGFGLHQWKSFRRQLRSEVDSGMYGAFVRTDLAAFFERIPHGALEERLAALGVRDDVARELRALLKALMGKGVGLPQGPDVSAVLANCYLQPLDQAVLSAGYGYVRYVDDIVLLARDRPQAKLGLRLLEREARELDLLIQSAKTTLVVGPAAMKAEAHKDDEIGAVDYVVRRSGRRTKTVKTRALWKSQSRRRPLDDRFIRYLLGRLTDNRDPAAVNWVLKRLGDFDWMAKVSARYLARFAGQTHAQRKISEHLISPNNVSEWEEALLYRTLLSAKTVRRSLLDRARFTAENRNADQELRQWAVVLLGRHGTGADHQFIVRVASTDFTLARAAILALQSANPKTRGGFYADVSARFAELKPIVAAVKGSAVKTWPLYQ